MADTYLQCPHCSNRDINYMRFAEVNTSADYYFIRHYDRTSMMIDPTGKGGDITTESTHIWCEMCGGEFPVPDGVEVYQ